MRILLEPSSIRTTARKFSEIAAGLSLVAVRVSGVSFPVMPASVAGHVRSLVNDAAGDLRTIALESIGDAQELNHRVALLELGATDESGFAYWWNLMWPGAPGFAGSDVAPFEQAFVEEQTLAVLGWLLTKRAAPRVAARLAETRELLAMAGAKYDDALDLFDKGRYWDVLTRYGDVSRAGDEYASLLKLTKMQGLGRAALRGLGESFNIAGAALQYQNSSAKSVPGKMASGALSMVFTKNGPLIAYDFVTGGAGGATGDLVAVSLEGISDGEIELDDYAAWSEANSRGDNGWMMQRYSQLGDAIGESDSLSMYELGEDGELHLGPPWRWFD